MKQPPNKIRLSVEREKVRRTSHWDWDYMPLKEMEKHYAQLATADKPRDENTNRKPFWSQRKIALACIFGGLAIISLAVTIARHLTTG